MMRKVFENAGWLLGGRGANAALSLVYLALATRALGLTDFGNFVLIVGIGQALAGFINFQSWQFVVRWGSELEERGEMIGFAVALDLISIVVGAVVTVAVVGTVPIWLGLPETLVWPAGWFCFAALCAIRSTPIGILRLHGHFARAAGAESVLPVVRAIGAAIAAFAMPTITAFLAAWAVAELATAAAYWALALRLEPKSMSAISPRRFAKGKPGIWRFLFSTNFSGSLSVVGRQVVLLLIGALGGAAMAGLYRIASQLGQALLKLAQSLLRAVYPELVRAGDGAGMLAGRVIRFALPVAAVAVAVAALGGEWLIVAIAGKGYAAAYLPMVILAGAAALELVGASWDALLVASGRAGTVFLLRAIPLVGALIAMPFLISAAGVMGAATAILVSGLLTVAGLAIAVRPTAVPAQTPLTGE